MKAANLRGRPWTCAGCGGQWSTARRPALVLGPPSLLRLCPACAAKSRTVAAVAWKSARRPVPGPLAADAALRRARSAHLP